MEQHTLLVLEYQKIADMLLSRAQSEPGRILCGDLGPATDLETATRRQEETAATVAILLSAGTPPLSGITDVRPAARRAAAGSSLSCPELLRVAALLRGAKRLQAFAPDEDDPNPVYAEMRHLEPLEELEQALSGAIAGEDELHDRASPELYSLRRRIREAQGRVKDILDRIVRSHSRALQEQLVTLRGDRYVVPVRAEYRNEVPGIVHDVSSSGSTVFVEPMAVVEANNKIRQLRSEEQHEIERILAELSARVGDETEALSEDVRRMAWLDFQTAKARLALDQHASRPLLNNDGRIVLRGARHPLIPEDQVVPLDFHIGLDFETLVITGPNTGGKTVALKTCGLLTLMALSGLQIPARDRSEISVFDNILADIGDEQSIEQSLSTFSSHMSNLVTITREAGPGTLVLLDELGSGTDPSEGAALAISVLDHLRARGCITVATTHYKELKGYAIETARVENACCEFDTDTLQPTYRLLIGIPGVSNAFVISAKLGLDSAIIENARTLLSEEGIRFEELLQDVEKSHSQSRRLQEEAARMHEEARETKEQADTAKSEIEEKRTAIFQKARERARSELVQYTAEVEQLIKDVRVALREERLEDADRLVKEARQNVRENLRGVEGAIGKETLQGRDTGAIPDSITVGERYYVASLGVEGKVLSGPDNKDQYVLESGAMKVTVARAVLRMPESNRAKKTRTRTSLNPSGRKRAQPVPQAAFRAEIKLLGLTVDEALAKLDKFLDDAVVHGSETVRIVHGKGTGALRDAVSGYLRSDARVHGFRLGNYGEGDTGVTIAQMN